MTTPEKKVKDKVKAILKSMGVYYFMPATHGFGSSGVPDLIACIHGKLVGIECKANGGKPTALQLHNLNMIQLCGGKAIVVDETNIHEVEELMQCLKS